MSFYKYDDFFGDVTWMNDIVSTCIKCRSYRSEILHFKKKLPYKYVFIYLFMKEKVFKNDYVINKYMEYLWNWEVYIHPNNINNDYYQLSLEDLND